MLQPIKIELVINNLRRIARSVQGVNQTVLDNIHYLFHHMEQHAVHYESTNNLIQFYSSFPEINPTLPAEHALMQRETARAGLSHNYPDPSFPYETTKRTS